MIKDLMRFKIIQHIDGDQVDGIIKPNKLYVYWRKAKVSGVSAPTS